jgi:hypothetical protein
MIVYGDPSFSDPLNRFVRESLAPAMNPVGGDRLDAARDLLIRLGQIEQAAEDASGLPEALVGRIRRATDAAAAAFYDIWSGHTEFEPNWHGAQASAAALAGDAAIPDTSVRVKVPEGFAFYTLFPEQYAAASKQWAASHAADRAGSPVAVIGVRSIGTSLSALVQATLACEGWTVHRFTVRPGGHPFERRVDLSPGQLRGARFVIVVDEGPGASGSSMAAVARAVVEAGIDPPRVSFFPGHGGEPGPNASDEVRGWWRRIDRYVVPPDQLRWDGRSLVEQLAERTTRLIPGATVERFDDLSGGLWRDAIDRTRFPRPPAFPAFERTKYRCVTSDGRAVLWKFNGLGGGAEQMMRSLQDRARGGWTPTPLGTAFGFVATPWIDGTPLTRDDVSDDLIAHFGRYIRGSAGPALLPDEQAGAFDRLGEMLYWNAWESLGERAADATRALSDAAAGAGHRQPVLSYGDGRPGPYEWIRTASGRILKVDCAGHDADHTMIGKQPVDWDMAGAIVEWDLDVNRASELQAAAGLAGIPRERMDFYCATYAAFRIGMASMCALDATPYREQLERILSQL